MRSPDPRWTTRDFDPAATDRATWLRYHAFRRIRHAEFDPEDPFSPDEELEAHLREPWHTEVVHRWLTEQDGLLVASSNLEMIKPGAPEYESNKHLAWGWCAVCKPFRRQGIFRDALGRMHDVMRQGEARVLNLYTSDTDPDGTAAAEATGATLKQTERQSRLRFDAIDWPMMRAWVDDVAERAPGYRLELWADRVPEEVFEEYAAARTEMMNLMPWDDLEHGEITITPEDLRQQNERLVLDKGEHHTYVAREPGGRIVGITDVRWRPSSPKSVGQWFTGVHPDARGKGLGKAVKAAMALYLQERYEPDWIQTENSQTNDAMLGINVAMGFKPYRTWYAYQVDLDTLGRYLGRGG